MKKYAFILTSVLVLSTTVFAAGGSDIGSSSIGQKFTTSLGANCEVPSAQFIVNSFHRQGFRHYTVDTQIDLDFNAINQAYAMATWELSTRLPNVSAEAVYAAMPASCMKTSSARCFGAAFSKIAKQYGCKIR